MAYWRLIFRGPGDPSRWSSLTDIASLVAKAIGAPVETYEVETLEGNPHDAYVGRATITGKRPDAAVRVAIEVMQYSAYSTGARQNSDIFVELQALPAEFAAKLETWHRLRDALAPIHYVDETLTSCNEEHSSRIVDEAERFGHTETAARLRREMAD